jgi:periplasmic divalent cation tolerance protein
MRVLQVQYDDRPVLIYSTFPTQEAAEKAGSALIEGKLAACVNIIPGMVSLYVWQGERHRDCEVVVLIKTRARLAEAAIREATQLHPYTNPAFLVLPVDSGAQRFLQWIMDQTEASARHTEA